MFRAKTTGITKKQAIRDYQKWLDRFERENQMNLSEKKRINS